MKEFSSPTTHRKTSFKYSPRGKNISNLQILGNFCKNSVDPSPIGNNISIHELIQKNKTQNCAITKLYTSFMDANSHKKSKSPISERSIEKNSKEQKLIKLPNNEKIKKIKDFSIQNKSPRYDISHLHDKQELPKASGNLKYPTKPYLSNIKLKGEELKNTLTLFKEQIPIHLYESDNDPRVQYQLIQRKFSDVVTSQTLRKVLPQAFSTTTGSRMEGLLITKILNDVKDKGNSISETVHVLFWELQRQIMMECQERGLALAQLWNERNDLEKVYLEEISHRNDIHEDRFKDDYNRINGLCNRIIDNEKMKVEEISIKLTEMKARNFHLEDELRYKEESDDKFIRKINDLSRAKDLLVKKVKDLMNENKGLKDRLENEPRSIANEESFSSSSSSEEKQKINEKRRLGFESSLKSLEDLLQEETIENMNNMNINFIPDRPRSELYQNKETQFSQSDVGGVKEIFCQTNLELLDKSFDLVCSNSGNLKEFLESYSTKGDLDSILEKKEMIDLFQDNSQGVYESPRNSNISINSNQNQNQNPIKNPEIQFKGSRNSILFNPEYLYSSSLEDIKESIEPPETVDISPEKKMSRKKSLFFNFKIKESPLEIDNNENLNDMRRKTKENEINFIKASFEDSSFDHENADKVSLSDSKNSQTDYIVNDSNPYKTQDLMNLSPMLHPNLQILGDRKKSRSSTIAFRRANDIEENKRKKLLTQFLKAPPDSKKFIQLIQLYRMEVEKSQKSNAESDKFKKDLEEMHISKESTQVLMVQLESDNQKLLEEVHSLKKKLVDLITLKDSTSETQYLTETTKKRTSNTRIPSYSSVKDNDFEMLSQTRRQSRKKSILRTTKEEGFNVPVLGQKVEYELGKKNEFGRQIIEKLDTMKVTKFKNFMHIKILLKTIHNIYTARIIDSKEKAVMKDNDFGNFCYNYFLKLFGFKSIADQRFLIFLLSIKKNLGYFRVNVFAKFMGILPPPATLTIEELNKYLDGMEFILNQSNLGTSITNNETELRFFVPYIRALQYTGMFADSRTTPEENQELIKEIEKLKEVDPKSLNKAGIIDFDLFMERVLYKYRVLLNRAKIYVINAFAASDLDGNGMCNLDEFLLLNKHIEAEKFNEEELTNIFNDAADIENEGEKNLSFDKFSVVSVDNNLFTDKRQNDYLGIRSDRELERKFIELKGIWISSKEEITNRFERLTIIPDSEIENWFGIIEVLNDRITNDSKDIKPILIAYKILDNESKELYEEQLEEEKNFKSGMLTPSNVERKSELNEFE